MLIMYVLGGLYTHICASGASLSAFLNPYFCSRVLSGSGTTSEGRQRAHRLLNRTVATVQKDSRICRKAKTALKRIEPSATVFIVIGK